MTPIKNLELKGTFLEHPFAELLVEIAHSRLTGSLRLSNAAKKSIVYFREGALVFAVANARSLRLFSILLDKKKIEQPLLAKFSNFANDLDFVAALVEKNAFDRKQVDEFIVIQIEAIIVDALSWPGGDWHFTPLARSRNDLIFDVDAFKVLIDYARCVPAQDVLQRFRSVKEAFEAAPDRSRFDRLQPDEGYVLSRFEQGPLAIEQLRQMSSIPEAAVLQ
ncbi:MAG: DUF4388 domain-containing protein, partial [Acidobacteria bacterium]|nr:DUF4388 domain-containing protein [Acidobacteriota bacterium]